MSDALAVSNKTTVSIAMSLSQLNAFYLGAIEKNINNELPSS